MESQLFYWSYMIWVNKMDIISGLTTVVLVLVLFFLLYTYCYHLWVASVYPLVEIIHNEDVLSTWAHLITFILPVIGTYYWVCFFSPNTHKWHKSSLSTREEDVRIWEKTTDCSMIMVKVKTIEVILILAPYVWSSCWREMSWSNFFASTHNLYSELVIW